MLGVSVKTIQSELMNNERPISRKERTSLVVASTIKRKTKRLISAAPNQSTRSVTKTLQAEGVVIAHQTVWRVARRGNMKKKKKTKKWRLLNFVSRYHSSYSHQAVESILSRSQAHGSIDWHIRYSLDSFSVYCPDVRHNDCWHQLQASVLVTTFTLTEAY